MFSKRAHASVWVMSLTLIIALGGGPYGIQSHRVPAIHTVAFVPQTAGAMLWEVEHFGATVAAEKRKYANAQISRPKSAVTFSSPVFPISRSVCRVRLSGKGFRTAGKIAGQSRLAFQLTEARRRPNG